MTNVDRTAQNPNLLCGTTGSGSSITAPRSTSTTLRASRAEHARRVSRGREHVLLPYASLHADRRLVAAFDGNVARAVEGFPRSGLTGGPTECAAYLGRRRAASPQIVDEAKRVRASPVRLCFVRVVPPSTRRADRRRRDPFLPPLGFSVPDALDHPRLRSWRATSTSTRRDAASRGYIERVCSGRPWRRPDRGAGHDGGHTGSRAVEHDRPALRGADGPLRRPRLEV